MKTKYLMHNYCGGSEQVRVIKKNRRSTRVMTNSGERTIKNEHLRIFNPYPETIYIPLNEKRND